MHQNSKLLFSKYAAPIFKDGMRVLEIGPNGLPSTYQKLVSAKSLTWETLELFAAPGITYTAKSEYEFPVPDNGYDIVLSGQVIEHVRKLWVWIREVARVCKPGGRVITINPISWPYHEAPVDCWRIYPEGMKAVYEEGGLAVETSVFESLAPFRITTGELIGQIVNPLLGKKRAMKRQDIDAITIGVKK